LPMTSKLDEHIGGYVDGEFPSKLRPLKKSGFILPAREIAGLLPIPLRNDIPAVEYSAGGGTNANNGPSF